VVAVLGLVVRALFGPVAFQVQSGSGSALVVGSGGVEVKPAGDEVLPWPANTDSELYGGSGVGNLGGVTAEEKPWHDQPCSAEVTLPPLGVVWLVPEG